MLTTKQRARLFGLEIILEWIVRELDELSNDLPEYTERYRLHRQSLLLTGTMEQLRKLREGSRNVHASQRTTNKRTDSP